MRVLQVGFKQSFKAIFQTSSSRLPESFQQNFCIPYIHLGYFKVQAGFPRAFSTPTYRRSDRSLPAVCEYHAETLASFQQALIRYIPKILHDVMMGRFDENNKNFRVFA